MKFIQWMEATNAKAKGVGLAERIRRTAVRNRVYAAAGTTASTLYVAKCRGSIGRNLIERLQRATENEEHKILLDDELNELDGL